MSLVSYRKPLIPVCFSFLIPDTCLTSFLTVQWDLLCERAGNCRVVKLWNSIVISPCVYSQFTVDCSIIFMRLRSGSQDLKKILHECVYVSISFLYDMRQVEKIEGRYSTRMDAQGRFILWEVLMFRIHVKRCLKLQVNFVTLIYLTSVLDVFRKVWNFRFVYFWRWEDHEMLKQRKADCCLWFS